MSSRTHIHVPKNIGDSIADHIAGFVGSWPFVLGMTAFLVLWVVINVVALFRLHFDPYPFILLNLCMSFLAGYTGPFIMMSQNREAAKDKLRDDVEASEVKLLLSINQQQLAILEVLKHE